MGVGLGVFLIAVGLIFALAVHVHAAGVDLQTVGWILTVVGILELVLFFTIWRTRRRVVVPDDSIPGRTVVEEHTSYLDPPL